MSDAPQPQLKRRLSLALLTLYGLGTTIGAGIFVLSGKVAGVAGYAAPLSFLIASVLAGLTALAFAELSARFPKSAGEAVYVMEGFGFKTLATLVGLAVALTGLVSAAAISKGFVGYAALFFELPSDITLTLLIAGLTALAILGIAESVAVAALFTILEAGALLFIVWLGRDALLSAGDSWHAMASVDLAALGGVLTGVVLAFYAYIGFEDMVNVAEEVKDEKRTLPRAILLTLAATTVIYLLVSLTTLAVAPPAQLAASDAPIALVYELLTGRPAIAISLIAAVAVMNGALIQIIMASRVFYGLGQADWLPPLLGRVSARTGTPVIASLLAGGFVLFLALTTPLIRLAEVTSFLTLMIFALVNFALVRLKTRGGLPQVPFCLPIWLPALGAVVALCFAALQGSRFLGLEL